MPSGRLPENTLSGGCSAAKPHYNRQKNGVARGNAPRAPDVDMALLAVGPVLTLGIEYERSIEEARPPHKHAIILSWFMCSLSVCLQSSASQSLH